MACLKVYLIDLSPAKGEYPFYYLGSWTITFYVLAALIFLALAFFVFIGNPTVKEKCLSFLFVILLCYSI